GASNAGEPAFAVFAGPEFVGGGAVFDVAVGGIDVEWLAGAIGDISEVAEDCVFVAFLNVAISRWSVAYGVDEVGEVLGPAVVAFFAFVGRFFAIGSEEAVA